MIGSVLFLLMISPNTITCIDAIDGMKQLPDESVDLIITDPPYNIASPNKRTLKGKQVLSTSNLWGQWDTYHPFDYDVLMCSLISQAWRVLKNGGGFYLFTAVEESGAFARMTQRRGFLYRNTLALVKKSPLPSLTMRNWRRAFELCLYVTKGRPETFQFLSQQECVNMIACATSEFVTDHPTEKPLTFIRRLVEVSSKEGDLVLDPFMGSGTTAFACKQTGRRWIGFDQDEEYVRMAERRLGDVQLNLTQAEMSAR